MWVLDVDESGRFGPPEEAPIVAGVLTQEGNASTNPEVLRATMCAIAPDLPWPLHTAHLTQPVTFALASRAARETRQAARSPSVIDGASDKVLAWLEWKGPRVASQVREAIQQFGRGMRPAIELVSSLERQSAGADGAARRQLREEGNRVLERLAELVNGIAPHLALFAAAEARTGDAMGFSWPPGSDDATRRYFGLLAQLVQRVLDVLGRSGNRRAMRLRVLNRPVVVRGSARHILPEDLRSFLRECISVPGNVEVEVAPPHGFDARSDSLAVVADFVACRSVGSLRALTVPLRDVEYHVCLAIFRHSQPEVLRSGDPSLAHLSSSGAPGSYLARLARRQAADGDVSALDDLRLRLWAREQAREWAVHLLRRSLR